VVKKEKTYQVLYYLFESDEGETMSGGGNFWRKEELVEFLTKELKKRMLKSLEENPYRVFSFVVNIEPDKEEK